MTPPARDDFASDNTAGICPEAWAALAKANVGTAPSYGDDDWTAQLCARVREVFETECEVFLVFNGTAANGLALAQLARPFQSILCHKYSHLQTDECGAPEFFSGGAKLLLLGGANGKIDLAEAEATILEQHELHGHKPAVLSLTQATESGTVYRRDEVERIASFAHEKGLLVHMDGARFANAVSTLQCAPREITWESGVDVLCFGGTKNGLGAGELVIFFRKELAAEFDYRAKQGGQLASKMRFLAAPWLALLRDNTWLRNAEHANSAALQLADLLGKQAGAQPVYPVEANGVFLRLPEKIAFELRARGWQFYKFIEPDIYRLMCSWSTTDERIAEFVNHFAKISAG